jgi:hypothetical protein
VEEGFDGRRTFASRMNARDAPKAGLIAEVRRKIAPVSDRNPAAATRWIVT